MFSPRVLVLASLVTLAGCRCGEDPDATDGGMGGGSGGGSAGGAAGGGSAGGMAGGGMGGMGGTGGAGGSMGGGTADAGSDAGVPDAGPADAGELDAGIPDSGVPDAGPVDSGTPDAGQCMTAASCPGADTACRVRTCIATACGFANADAGTALAAQTMGDCQLAVCDGDGGVLAANDDLDVPADDGNVCTSQACSMGMPTFPPMPINTMCPAGFCNASGACVQCNVAGQCPGSDTECAARTCVGGMCGRLNTDAGTAVTAQTAGDCRRNECDGDGGVVAAQLDTDIPNDMQQCTNDTCVGGVPTFSPVPENSACSQGGGSFCDMLGNCVACNIASQCGASTDCRTYACNMNACSFTDAMGGTATTMQTPGDCKTNVCDGMGGTTVANADMDVPADDGNACTDQTCSMGTPSFPFRPENSPCPTGVCTSMGVCVQCNTAAQCGANSECATWACNTNSCSVTLTGAGTPVASQTAGDCRENQCDGDGGVVSAVLDTDLPADEPNQCTTQVCTMGTPGFPLVDAGTACNQTGGIACDDTGLCQPAPQVVSTTPADGATPVAGPAIAVTFNVPMRPSSLTAQTAAGACAGTVHVSLDNFATCVAFASASGTMSGANTTVTFNAAPGLLVNRAYRIRVTTGATGANNVPLSMQYTSPTGFTTTSPNICDGSLVISQVYGAGGSSTTATYMNDLVELHNRGSTTINLSGLSLQYAASTGTNWQALALTGSIPAGGYYLIRLASSGANGAIVSPDLIGSINLGAAAGRVAVVTQTAALAAGTVCPANAVDYVGWGGGTTICEGLPAPSTAATTSVSRTVGGCRDTGVNVADFVATTPAARNSFVMPNVCACVVVNESNAPLEADYCTVQHPPALTADAGTFSELVYGRIYEAGMTEGGGGHADIVGQVGYGPATANPQYQSGWTWTNATFNAQFGNDDEYQASLTAASSGDYRYVYRFSLNQGLSWTYCDRNAGDFGAGSNGGLTFELADMPVLTVP